MKRVSSIDAAGRTVLPLTHLIVSSLEGAFAQVRMRTRARRDALAQMQALVSETARTRADERARTLLGQRRRGETLQRAASSMGDVDLDSAWRAALRGDEAVLHARMAPHVREPRRAPIKGTPWRGGAWLSKR